MTGNFYNSGNITGGSDGYGVAFMTDLNGNFTNTGNITGGEYGVYTKASPPADRIAWIKAVNTALDEFKIGRAMWDYAGGFRMTVGKAGSRAIERDVGEAMGLRP
mgnify:CR=1 FL=1